MGSQVDTLGDNQKRCEIISKYHIDWPILRIQFQDIIAWRVFLMDVFKIIY